MQIDLKKLFNQGDGSNEKLHQTLLKALANAHIKEFDYLKFRQSVSSMMDMDMDKVTSVKSAFATASTMGLTKDQLLKTAYHYQTALNKEKEKFAGALKNRIANDIDGKRIEAQKFVKEIESHKRKIEQMQKEIAAYQKKVDSVETNVAAATKKIEATRDGFKVTFDNLYEQLETDIQSIEELL